MKLKKAEEKQKRELRNRTVGHIMTLDELLEIERLLQDWVRKHPDDEAVLGECKSLVMLKSAFLSRKKMIFIV